MMQQLRLLCFFIAISFSSCKILSPNRIYKTDREYEFTVFNDSLPSDYLIEAGDKFELFIFSNDGYKLVDPYIALIQNYNGNPQANSLIYEVNPQGKVVLPMIGEFLIRGMPESVAEDSLAKKFAAHYILPYVQITITNRRALVFRGNDPAFVVPILNLNTTIMEAIALAGGIPPTGKANRIMLIRNAGKPNQLIAQIDLSTIEGLQQAGKLVKANDIIYIKPTINTAFFKEIAPILSAVSGVLVLYSFFSTR